MKQPKQFSFSYRNTQVFVILFALLCAGCSDHRFLGQTETCKIYSYIDIPLHSYVKERFQDGSPYRMAVIPFDVPETFARSGPDGRNLGQQLARRMTEQLTATGAVPIVELFNRDNWPGKKAEFYTGNYGAIEQARAAGYDFVLVGYLEEQTNGETISLATKLIDTQNQTTVWSGRTNATSNARELNKFYHRTRVARQRDDFFAFPERFEEAISCTAKWITVEDIEDRKYL